MRFVDEYRDPAAARALVARITDVAGDDHFKFMEVCGGHTHTIYRHGIEHVLPSTVELVHGPGCPVCVIPMGRVDDAIAVAETPGVIFTSFGDMASLGNEGWFKSNTPAGDGAMVTSEPSGTMAWMPLNNHVSVKPTYDVHSTVNYDPAAAPGVNRVFIGTGRLVSKVVNAPDANYPTTGSRTFNWHSAEPIGSYLVENSVGHFDESERMATAGDVIYYEYQSRRTSPRPARPPTRRSWTCRRTSPTSRSSYNGPFPFNANGIVVALPSASFEEEMQTKIVFVGGSDRQQRARPSATRTCTSGGATRLLRTSRGTRSSRRATRTSRSTSSRRDIAGKAAGPVGSAAYNAAFEAVDRDPLRRDQQVQHDQHDVLERRADQPDVGPTCSATRTPTRARACPTSRCGRSSATTNFGKVSKEIQTDYSVRLDHAARRRSRSTKVHAEPVDRLPRTSSTRSSSSGGTRATPGTRRPATSRRSRARAWPAAASMTPTAAARTTASTCRSTAGGTVPATLSLTLGTAASFGAFTPGRREGLHGDDDARTSSRPRATSTLSVADPSSDRSGPSGQRHVLAPVGAEGRRHQPGGHVGRRRLGQRRAADAAHLGRPGLQRRRCRSCSRSRSVPRRAAHRHLRKTLTFTLSTTTP